MHRGEGAGTHHDWLFRETPILGVDYSDAEQVATYDAKQGNTIEAERALVEELGIRAGDVVIEHGCGTGHFAMAAAERCGHVHAVDISAAMLAMARSRAGGLANLSYHQSGFLTYEHRGDQADWIVSKYALHHLPDAWKMVALVKMYRALKPGGGLYLRDVTMSFEPVEWVAHLSNWVEVGSRSGFSREEYVAHLRDEYSTFASVMETMLENVGFRIDTRDYPNSMHARYVCRKPMVAGSSVYERSV